MTRRRALEVLVEHAARNVAGAGHGMRPEVSIETCELVRDAVVRLWPEIYNYPVNNLALRNLGLLPLPQESR